MTTAQHPILTVWQLTQAIKLSLEQTFPHIWVKGEVSNIKIQSSGHIYFSLKDPLAQISCVAFRQDAASIAKIPQVGDQIVVQAEMNVWPPKGSYQLVVRQLMHVGRGELLLKLEQLKQKLQALGYFALERKRPLPKFAKTIGVVTSPTGAVIQDVINVLTRRLGSFHLLLNPVKVQGEGAAEEIAKAIRQFNEQDLGCVIIVCRGGGSFEDLAPFNTEIVAQAIFESKIPIVSAVGHETDVSISDLVADIRAPTPSAAAEIVSHETALLLQSLVKMKRQTLQHAETLLSRYRQMLQKAIRHPLFSSPTYLLEEPMMRLDDVTQELDRSIFSYLQNKKLELSAMQKRHAIAKPSAKMAHYRAYLLQIHTQLGVACKRYFNERKQGILARSDLLQKKWDAILLQKRRAFAYPQFEKQIPLALLKAMNTKKKDLQNLIDQLQARNPRNILAKGYTICFSQKDGSVISSIKQLSIGEQVRITFVDGEAEAQIVKI